MTTVDDAIDWRSSGACLTADPDLFFPVSATGASQRQEARAKAICAGCQVRAECLRFALDSGQMHGVWGGLGEAELTRLRRSGRGADTRPARIPGTGRVARRRGLQPPRSHDYRAGAS
jgi:WhiB family transcriptional regulator, redox-sensing transcriptional regulator